MRVGPGSNAPTLPSSGPRGRLERRRRYHRGPPRAARGSPGSPLTTRPERPPRAPVTATGGGGAPSSAAAGAAPGSSRSPSPSTSLARAPSPPPPPSAPVRTLASSPWTALRTSISETDSYGTYRRSGGQVAVVCLRNFRDRNAKSCS